MAQVSHSLYPPLHKQQKPVCDTCATTCRNQSLPFKYSRNVQTFDCDWVPGWHFVSQLSHPHPPGRADTNRRLFPSGRKCRNRMVNTYYLLNYTFTQWLGCSVELKETCRRKPQRAQRPMLSTPGVKHVRETGSAPSTDQLSTYWGSRYQHGRTK